MSAFVQALKWSIVIGAVLWLWGCGGAKSVREASVTESADNGVEATEEMLHAPDTVYDSAERVAYRVDTLIRDIDGRLESMSEMYADAPGALTFRKGPLRDAVFGGKIKGVPSKIDVDWIFVTEEDYTLTDYGTWGGGTGWTGQPLYVCWPDSCLDKMRNSSLVTEGFSGSEIMVGSLVGEVYFMDFVTGKSSREPINVGNPVKGTMSLDPTLNGNLYVGHGIPEKSPFGALVIDLFKNEVADVTGKDPEAWRGWGAYDSSPVRVGQFLFRPGENGTLYKYLVAPGRLSLHSKLRYRVNGAAPGIEASMSVWRDYGYIADNHGNIICVNLNDLHPVWHFCLGDDVDATPVISEENGKPYLYTGCEIDRRGEGDALFVKLDALDGNPVWMSRIPGRREDIDGKHFDGGYYASALPGSGDCSELIYSNCVLNTDGRNGVFVAFERSTGAVRYTVKLNYYAWSSPVGFLNEDGEEYVFTADCSGNVYVIRGIDGRIMCRSRVGANFESSPVVIDNHVVIGSRGNSIYKLSII